MKLLILLLLITAGCTVEFGGKEYGLKRKESKKVEDPKCANGHMYYLLDIDMILHKKLSDLESKVEDLEAAVLKLKQRVFSLEIETIQLLKKAKEDEEDRAKKILEDL